jgi:hypothetical protein
MYRGGELNTYVDSSAHNFSLLKSAQPFSDCLKNNARMHDNCSELASRSSFAAYVALMKNVTAPDLTVADMAPCRQQICSVLYGVGNPDISGVGVRHILHKAPGKTPDNIHR